MKGNSYIPFMVRRGDGSTLSLDFTAMSSLDSRFTFTRASTTSTFINSSGLIATAGTNIPRFDHDPTTLAPRGLLIEGSATNLLNWSESFATSGGTFQWNYNLYVTRNATQIVSPDGTQNAYRFNETTDNQIHRISYPGATGSAGSYLLSVWVQIIDTSAPRRLYINAVSFMGAGALFDIDPATQTGASGSAVAVSGTAANRAGTWVKYPNNWYRCSVLGTYVTNSTIYFQINRASSATATDDTFAGSTSNGLALWGAQLETGSGASSYIPTGASTVQRAADDCRIDNVATSFGFNSSEGTILIQYGGRINTGSNRSYTFLPASGSNEQIFEGSGTAFNVFTSGAFVAQIGATSTIAAKVAAAYKANDFAVSVNGGAAATDTAGAVPTTITRVSIGGSAVNAAAYSNGPIIAFKYWPTRLPNATLQSLTQ